MDVADQARHLETRQRDQALLRQQTHREQATPVVRDGIRCCLDCDTAIDKRRLQAYPSAVRCVECQQIHEQQSRQRSL